MTESSENLIGKLCGDIYVRQFDSDDEIAVCLYGTPTGLKSLAEKLMNLANLNQDSMKDATLPNGEGAHFHFKLESRKEGDPDSLILGRLDAKGTGDDSWFFSGW